MNKKRGSVTKKEVEKIIEIYAKWSEYFVSAASDVLEETKQDFAEDKK